LNIFAHVVDGVDACLKAAREELRSAGMDHMPAAGVKVGLGTDLLGSTYTQQCREFTLRSEVFTPIQILKQATSVAAEILMERGKLDCVAPSVHADLIVILRNQNFGLAANPSQSF
jgi:imidazolonepropionase-like amidohydrolase